MHSFSVFMQNVFSTLSCYTQESWAGALGGGLIKSMGSGSVD